MNTQTKVASLQVVEKLPIDNQAIIVNNQTKVAILRAMEKLPIDIQSIIMKLSTIRFNGNRIAADSYHSVGLKQDGYVVEWRLDEPSWGGLLPGPGWAPFELDRFKRVESEPPLDCLGVDEPCFEIPPRGPFVSVAMGSVMSLGLRADGTVVSWGYHERTIIHEGPFVAISAFGNHSLGLKKDGSVVGWGSNEYGETKPQEGPFIAIAAGGDHSLGLKEDGTVVGWGSNEYGETNPQEGTFVAVAAGLFHSLGIKANGSVIGWGSNYFGQTTPQGGQFVAISAGRSYSMGLKEDRSIIRWGVDFEFSIVFQEDGSVLRERNERESDENMGGFCENLGGPFAEMASGLNHAMGLKEDGTVIGWGN
jgi:alpha-tubulin suppressor-like RCC1 family protein